MTERSLSDYLYALDADRNVVPVRNALERHGRAKEIHVGDDTVNGCRVSTVFIGIDAGTVNPPRVFETAVFRGDEVEIAGRWTTWEEAEAMHRRTVRRVKEKVWSPDPRTGALIKAFRESRGMSSKAMAEAMGITVQHYSRLEHDTGGSPRLKTLMPLLRMGLVLDYEGLTGKGGRAL